MRRKRADLVGIGSRLGTDMGGKENSYGIGLDLYIGICNWISVSAYWYCYLLSAGLISAVLSKYRLKSLDIGQIIGIYRYFQSLSAKYQLRKNIGIGIGG